jgi:hypothetical protein
MSGELVALSPEMAAELVPPAAREELLSVLQEAVALLPLAEVVVAACDGPGIKGSEPARTAGRVSSAYSLLAMRVRQLAIGVPLRTRLAQLLEYHAELVGQAQLAAYGHRSERTERARGTGGFGPPASELTRLGRTLDSVLRTPPATELD